MCLPGRSTLSADCTGEPLTDVENRRQTERTDKSRATPSGNRKIKISTASVSAALQRYSWGVSSLHASIM